MTTMLLWRGPSKRRGGQAAILDAVGDRIAGMAKMPRGALSARYALENASDYFPGAAGEEDAASSPEAAREGVDRLVEYIRNKDFDRLIFVGRGVADSFGINIDAVGGYLSWFRTEATGPSVWLAILPHPSSVNRWYNDPENRLAAALFLQTEQRTRGGPPTPTGDRDDPELLQMEREDATAATNGERTF